MSNSDYSSEEETIIEESEESIEYTTEYEGGLESITNDDDFNHFKTKNNIELIAEENLNDEWCKFKNDYQNMSKDELLDLIKKDKKKKREYIQKYQKTPNGRVKTRQASKNYYNANRAKILAKKKLAYLNKKNQNK
jgi:Mg/Co/Ni transporter MgtE